MAGKNPPPTGTAWTLANVICYVAIIGYAIAAWAVFKDYSLWEAAALLSGIIGLIAAVPLIVGILAWGGLYLRDSRIRQLIPFRRAA